MIVFNGKVIQGTRACKTRTKSYEAFSSINYPYLAVLQDGCILQYIENACLPEPVFYDTLDERVALLKLIPGARAELAGWMLRHNDALILKASAWAASRRMTGMTSCPCWRRAFRAARPSF